VNLDKIILDLSTEPIQKWFISRDNKTSPIMAFILFPVNIILFSLLFPGYANSQSKHHFDFFTGYGFYEGFSIGCKYNFKSNSQSLDISFGTSNFNFSNKKHYTFCTEHNFAIMRQRKINDSEFRWYLTNKLIYWNLEDEYYIWKVISLIPSISRQFKITHYIKFLLDTGLAFNITLFSKRKTYTTIGWPYHVMPNARILILI
jgi:hypothetical protein